MSLEDAKKEYLTAKAVYQHKLKLLKEVMKPYDKLYEAGVMTFDDYT